MDTASQREPEGTPARITASGLLGGPMRAWDTNGDSPRRFAVALPLVWRDGDAESSGIPPRQTGAGQTSPEVDSTGRDFTWQDRLRTSCQCAMCQDLRANYEAEESEAEASEDVKARWWFWGIFVIALGVGLLIFLQWLFL